MIVRVDTYQHRSGPDRALVDVCYDAHGTVVDVRLRTKLQPDNPTYSARWSPPWPVIEHTVQTHWPEHHEED